jgi:hypothetical protein
MKLAVVGVGLVSPTGRTAEEHAFFVRARVPSPPGSPFDTAEGERVDARHCPWLGAHLGVADRLIAMAEQAVASAMAPLADHARADRVPLFLCTSAVRPGLAADDAAALERALVDRLKAPTVRRYTGDAGFFAALKEADPLVSSTPAVIVAVDTLISLAALTEEVLHPPSPWSVFRPPSAEGAAAIAILGQAEARRNKLQSFGLVTGATVTMGAARDDNDEPVDGAALTVALRELPAAGPARAAFGQAGVDPLRSSEWQIASARNVARLHPECAFVSLEELTGRLGAAAGAASLVYGLAAIRHRIPAFEIGPSETNLAWAISRDGTRGAASFVGGEG